MENKNNAEMQIELLAASKMAIPWLGKLIADGGHQNSCNPNHAVISLERLEKIIEEIERAQQ